jgi:hypothetical protein
MDLKPHQPEPPDLRVQQRGRHPRTWREAIANDSSSYLQDGSDNVAMIGLPPHVLPGDELPRDVRPGFSQTTGVDVSELMNIIDFHKPVVVQARLGSGVFVKSRPKKLLSDS